MIEQTLRELLEDKVELDIEGIDRLYLNAYQPRLQTGGGLDNGILSCAEPQRLQQILDALDETRIEAVVRKWFARLPHPFSAEDRAAGYRYELSILQAEFAPTQVFDRPLSGRHLFEEVIRENIDLGRPDHVSLIFDRRITKRTPGRFRTRVMALLQALCLFVLLPQGFRNATLRAHITQLMGEPLEAVYACTHDL